MDKHTNGPTINPLTDQEGENRYEEAFGNPAENACRRAFCQRDNRIFS